MPYQIRQVGAKYCVYLKESGKKVGCHASKADAKAQIAAIEIRKHAESMGKLCARAVDITGALGQSRTEMFEGKEYVVLPVVALMQGVIWPVNSEHPELVTSDALRVAPSNWDGRPVMAGEGHPTIDGEQVSANSPMVLERSIGKIFNAHMDGDRLLMEAWIDPTKMEAQSVLQRVASGQLVEVSVGSLVVEDPTPGVYDNKPYFSVWRMMLPDHLAILPEGHEGACSGAMGCGIRAAHSHRHRLTESGLAFDALEATVSKKILETTELETLAAKALADTQDPADAFKELQVIGDGTVVYETASGKMYRRTYEVSDEGALTLAKDSQLEVEPRVYYEPVGTTDLKAAKGARHSQADMAKIQAIHDHTMELGAQCASGGMKYSEGHAPCGCKDKQKEQNMKARTKEQRESLIKTLRAKLDAKVVTKYDALAKASSSDILDAIVNQIKEKFGLSDAAAADIANLEESTLVELAGLSAPPDATDETPEDPAAPPPPPPPTNSEAHPETEEQFFKRNPEIGQIVTAARAQKAARKVELVNKLKVAKVHSEKDLQAKSLDELEALAKYAAAAVAATGVETQAVDFSILAPRETEEQVQDGAPAPIDLAARIKANRAKK